MRQFLPAIAFSLCAAGFTLTASLAAPQTGEIAVVFPLLTDERLAWDIVREAGGRFVAPTRFDNVVVAYAATADFQHRARVGGALMFLKAGGLCAPATDTDAR